MHPLYYSFINDTNYYNISFSRFKLTVTNFFNFQTVGNKITPLVINPGKTLAHYNNKEKYSSDPNIIKNPNFKLIIVQTNPDFEW